MKGSGRIKTTAFDPSQQTWWQYASRSLHSQKQIIPLILQLHLYLLAFSSLKGLKLSLQVSILISREILLWHSKVLPQLFQTFGHCQSDVVSGMSSNTISSSNPWRFRALPYSVHHLWSLEILSLQLCKYL